MYDKHKVIKPEELEVGMKVAYPYNVPIGWYKDFRYPMWVGLSVKRITPKRTKVVLEDVKGRTIELELKKESVYELDTDMEHENKCVGLYKECRKIINDCVGNNWRGLDGLPDDKLKEVHVHLTALDKLLKKEK